MRLNDANPPFLSVKQLNMDNFMFKMNRSL